MTEEINNTPNLILNTIALDIADNLLQALEDGVSYNLMDQDIQELKCILQKATKEAVSYAPSHLDLDAAEELLDALDQGASIAHLNHIELEELRTILEKVDDF